MGGEIRLESRTGGSGDGHQQHGTVFYFTVPYVLAAPGKQATKATAKPVTSTLAAPAPGANTASRIRPSTSSSSIWRGSSEDVNNKLTGKILLVDDNRVNLKLVERFVSKMGCTSVKAENGAAAVSMFRSDPSINLILMDKEMPVME